MARTHEVLAEARFTATSKDEQYNIVLTLIPSGCSDYGNRHALGYEVYEPNGKCVTEQGFDARYDRRFNTVDSFNKYAMEFVRDQIRDEFAIERVN